MSSPKRAAGDEFGAGERDATRSAFRSESRSRSESGSRLDFLDDLRGLAVLFMIVWHTVDGWLAPSRRTGLAYETLHLFGGLAAPLFLFLAGTSVALAHVKGVARKREGHTLTIVARGGVVFCFGYALRVALWLVDGGALTRPDAIKAWLPMLVGIATTMFGFRSLPRSRRTFLYATLGGIAIYGVGAAFLAMFSPTRLLNVMRVDVLQAIGVSIIVIALLAKPLALARTSRRALLLATVILLITASVSAVLPGPLPRVFAGYLGSWEGGRAIAMFPLTPWLAYGLAGAATGSVLARRASSRAETILVIGTIGGAMGSVLCEAVPHAFQWVARWPIVTALVRFGYRVGIICVLMVFAFAWSRTRLAKRAPTRDLGRASLLIYMVHLPFAYGALTRSFTRSFDLFTWGAWFTLLTFAMWLLARARLGPLAAIADRITKPLA